MMSEEFAALVLLNRYARALIALNAGIVVGESLGERWVSH